MKTVISGLRRLVPAVALTLILGACSDSTSGPGVDNDPDITTVSLFLTDAPGDVSRVWLDISQVTLIGDGPPVVMLDEPTGLIEVTELVNQAQTLVDDMVVDPTTFSQARLVLGGAVLETEDGDVFTMGGAEHPEGAEATGDLMCPSCTQSGLKVKLNSLSVGEGEDAGVLLDFDVGRSFGRQAGQSGKWIMSPVIHATKVDASDTESGDDSRVEITGAVELAVDAEGNALVIPECPAGEVRTLEDFIPTATATTLTDDEGNAVVISGEASEDGTFELKVLDPDTYELGFIASQEVGDGNQLVFEAGVDPATVTVAEGDDELGGFTFTITSATCESGSG